MEIKDYSPMGILIKRVGNEVCKKEILLPTPISSKEFFDSHYYEVLDYSYNMSYGNFIHVCIGPESNSIHIGVIEKPKEELDNIMPFLLKETEKLAKKWLIDITFKHTNSINKLANILEC